MTGAGREPWRRGAERFAAGRAREAHEAWEEAWLPLRGTDAGEVLRALAQLGAAYVHLEAGRERGFRRLARAAASRLERVVARGAARCTGLDLADLARAMAALAEDPDPRAAPRPRIDVPPAP